MKITFLGATKMVTGSNFLVEGAGKKFLVDCGMYQGGDRDEMQNHEPFAYDVNEIDFMLLTHAHIDHSGRIPKLYKEGYRNPVITTKATRDLCSIMLPDSGHIQEQEIEWRNRKRMREGKEALPPLYTAQDAIDTMEIFKPVNYDEIIEIDPNIYVRFNDAGHMLGSAIIEIWVKENPAPTGLRVACQDAYEQNLWFSVSPKWSIDIDAIRRPYESHSVRTYEEYEYKPRSNGNTYVRKNKRIQPNPLGALPKNIISGGVSAKIGNHQATQPSYLPEKYIFVGPNRICDA